MKDFFETLRNQYKLDFNKRIYKLIYFNQTIKCVSCFKNDINRDGYLYIDIDNAIDAYCIVCIENKREEYISNKILKSIWENIKNEQ